jgi:hypothetical protein
MGLEMPESKDLPSLLVTVEPSLMMSVVGLKAKLPLLSLVMVTAWPLLAAVVAVGVVPAVVAVGVVPVAGVGVEPEPEGAPPRQAAKRTSAQKRLMFGRAKFDLLRLRVLHAG